MLPPRTPAPKHRGSTPSMTSTLPVSSRTLTPSIREVLHSEITQADGDLLLSPDSKRLWKLATSELGSSNFSIRKSFSTSDSNLFSAQPQNPTSVTHEIVLHSTDSTTDRVLSILPTNNDKTQEKKEPTTNDFTKQPIPPSTIKPKLPRTVTFAPAEQTQLPITTFDEPILSTDGPKHYAVFPIKHHEMWYMYKQAVASFWTPEEIDLSQDVSDFERLSPPEKHFLKTVLAFFATADGVVNENLVDNFASEVQYPEAKCFYGFQIAVENIHNETYSLLLDTYVKDPTEKDSLFNAIEHIPAIQQKAKWTEFWTDPSRQQFSSRIIAMTAVEGIFFSASFCSIFWMKKRGLMPGLSCFSNELISHDEGVHCDFACLLHHSLLHPAAPATILRIIKEAVDIESTFVEHSLPVALIRLNADLMIQYVQFCADRLLVALSQPKYYEVTNPFPWMVTISLQGKTNFFEKRVGEYAKSGVGAETHHEFCLDASF